MKAKQKKYQGRLGIKAKIPWYFVHFLYIDSMVVPIRCCRLEVLELELIQTQMTQKPMLRAGLKYITPEQRKP